MTAAPGVAITTADLDTREVKAKLDHRAGRPGLVAPTASWRRSRVVSMPPRLLTVAVPGFAQNTSFDALNLAGLYDVAARKLDVAGLPGRAVFQDVSGRRGYLCRQSCAGPGVERHAGSDAGGHGDAILAAGHRAARAPGWSQTSSSAPSGPPVSSQHGAGGAGCRCCPLTRC